MLAVPHQHLLLVFLMFSALLPVWGFSIADSVMGCLSSTQRSVSRGLSGV